MLTVRILCVGKLKERYWSEACAEYAKRLKAFCKFSIEEIPESRLPEQLSLAEIDRALDGEAHQLLKRAGNSVIVALCIEGKLYSSEMLASSMQTFAINGNSEICFVIGSSYGLSPQVKKAARLQLSMSPMTFPHQLARVMLCEQVYRAFQISENGKYHK